MSVTQISDTKLKLQRIINNIKCLEQCSVKNDTANVSHIQQQLEADFEHLEHLPLYKIQVEIKRRQLKRKAAKARHKLNKTIVSTITTTKSTSISTNTTIPNTPLPSVFPKKSNHQLHNFYIAQRMLRTFELLKKLHYARSQDIEATREFAANLHLLEAKWTEILHHNQPQRTQQTKLEDQWDAAFFGPKQYNLHSNNVFAKSSSDLIAIRHTWDSYLTHSKDSGSSIPIGWILPRPDADERWLAYRKIPQFSVHFVHK